jgi:hypothetical protein
MMDRLRVAGLALGLTVLTGCEAMMAAAVPIPVAAGMTTLPQTKKLPVDHALSAATGRDCSILSYEKTGNYCPPYPQEVDRSRLTCIRTLGDVECHQQPDLYANGERTLGSPPPPPPRQP